jgi:arginine utilization protein RocB
LDTETIRRISMPVVNLGPFGYGAHQETERVDIAYSYGQLPLMLRALLEGLRP